MICSHLTTFSLSDHCFVECLLSASDLCNATWSRIDKMAKCYDDTLGSILDKHAPLRSKVTAVRPTVPRFNDHLKNLKAKRRKLERKMIKPGLQCDKDAYWIVCDAYSALLNETRKTYYSDLMNECAGDAKKLYRIVNSPTKECQGMELPQHDNPVDLANKFGDFFSKKIELVKTEIDSISVDPPDVHFYPPQVKSNASCQLDLIPTWLVKLCCDELVPVLSKMVILSLSEGNVPELWKTALVLPLKKPGLDPIFKNFRPVSNLPFVVKLAEKAVISQLSMHCAANAPLPENQSSYREHHSMETALLKVQNDILLSMD